MPLLFIEYVNRSDTMSNKNWDGNVSSLSGEFQTELLGKLSQPDVVAVRLGITGKGIQPNYQLIHTDHSVTTINGANHEKYDGADEFKDTNITEPLTRSDITRMILTGK